MRATTVLLAGAAGPFSAPLAAALRASDRAVRLLDPAAALHADALLEAADGCSTVVHVIAPSLAARETDEPLEVASERLRGTELALRAAEHVGAGFVLVSTTLTYADAGDEPQEAPDPVLEPAAWLASIQESELATFGAGVRFLVLRAGLPLGAATPAAEALRTAVARGDFPLPEGERSWVPLVHPEDFATLAAALIARNQNGVWDVISDTVPLDELVGAAAAALDAPAPTQRPLDDVAAQLGPVAADAWTVSRRVEPGGLRELDLAPSWTWREMLADALGRREQA